MFLKQKPVLIDFFPVNIHKYLADEGYFTLPYFRPKQKNKKKHFLLTISYSLNLQYFIAIFQQKQLVCVCGSGVISVR